MTARLNQRSKGWILLLLLLGIFVSKTNAQRIALKTNVLYDATLSPNIGIEFRTSRHFSMGIDILGNPVNIGKYKLNFVGIEGEGRYWFSRAMTRHFVGVMGWAENHDFRFNTKRHYGDAFAAGITYGYVWPISKRFNMEATIGAGVIHYRDTKWTNGDERPKSPNNTNTVLAPIKAGIIFTYILK